MGSYRDDREALRDRAARLERELQGARSELAEKDAALAEAGAEVSRLRRGARSHARRPTGLVPAVVAVAFASVAIGGVLWTTARRSPPAPATPPAAVAPAQVPLPAGAPATTPTEPVLTKLRFSATVVEVKGRADVQVGAPCELLVDASNVAGRLSFDEVVITCGGVELHRLSQRGGTITSLLSWVAGPAPDDPDNRWIASYEDLGARSADARAQAAFDSERGVGRVFTEGASPTEVRMRVEPRGVVR